MAKRQASMQCKATGQTGVLTFAVGKKHKSDHQAEGALVRIVTDRYSGIQVEMVKVHGVYSKGDQLTVARENFVSGKPN